MTLRSVLAARTASVAVLLVVGFQRSDDVNKREPAPAVPLAPAHVTVDGTATSQSPAGVYAACGLTAPPAAPTPAATPIAPPPTQGPLDRLADWTGLRVAVTGAEDPLAVYASRTVDGIAICLANRAPAPRDVRLAVKLPRGVYTVERRELQPDAKAILPNAQRMPGRVFAKPGVLAITDKPAAGAIVVYVLLNRNLRVARAAQVVGDRFRAAKAVGPSICAKLHAPLDECASHIAALERGISPGDRPRAVAHAHRAILTLAHAQALAGNAAGHGKAIADLHEALDALSAALCELSACCLNLVSDVATTAPDPAHPARQTVTATLKNCGAWGVTGVRLGISANRGCTVRPAEEAVFASLGPGQTVRATFTVDAPDGTSETAVTGHYGFVAEKTPAEIHLRPL